MNLRLILLLVLTAPAAALMAQTTAPATPPDASGADAAVLQEIGDLRNGLTAALNKGDIDQALTYLDPDIVVTWDNAEVSHGPAGVKAYFDKMMSGPDKRVESIKVNPVVEGRRFYGSNVLISYGTLGDEFKLTDGTEFTLNSRFSSLLVNKDGKWLMKGFHASANVFDNPVQSIVVKKVALWTGVIAAVSGLAIGFVTAKLLGRRPAPQKAS